MDSEAGLAPARTLVGRVATGCIRLLCHSEMLVAVAGAAPVPEHMKLVCTATPPRDRTGPFGRYRPCDTPAFNRVLYPLSYEGGTGASPRTCAGLSSLRGTRVAVYACEANGRRATDGYTVRVSIPPAQVESLLTSPEVERCVLLSAAAGLEPTCSFLTGRRRRPDESTATCWTLREESNLDLDVRSVVSLSVERRREIWRRLRVPTPRPSAGQADALPLS